MLHRHLLLD
uniref:Uncharacterized protein n=1 Tax=Anguilla anguilla TaxID=7936 RepID=A0A0E9UAK9_ANGAN